MQNSDKPIMTLMPVYNKRLTIITNLPIQIFFILWGLGIFGIMFSALFSLFMPASIAATCAMLLVGAATIFGIPIAICKATETEYARTKYTIYPDKIEYSGGLFKLIKKEIYFNRVKETSLTQGFFQGKYGLGTIELATDATDKSSGIKIENIENSEHVFQEIRNLIKI